MDEATFDDFSSLHIGVYAENIDVVECLLAEYRVSAHAEHKDGFETERLCASTIHILLK